MSIKQTIDKIRDELNNPSLNYQRRRYLEEYLDEVERYLKSHLYCNKVPTSLELYCNDHPESLECRIYEV